MISEIKNLKWVVGIVYCVRKRAPEAYKELNEICVSVLHIVKNLLSRRESTDPEILKQYGKLQLDFFPEIKTLTILRKYGSNLNMIINESTVSLKTRRRETISRKPE